MKLDTQERNTILAALRFYQREGMGEPSNRDDDIHDIATNGDRDISMDDEGIDELCEKINTETADTVLDQIRAAFPGFDADDEVDGADLVEFIAELLDEDED